MELNRRDTTRRAEVVRIVLEDIIRGGKAVVTLEGLCQLLQVSPEAAARILGRLVDAGLLAPAGDGVWTRVTS